MGGRGFALVDLSVQGVHFQLLYYIRAGIAVGGNVVNRVGRLQADHPPEVKRQMRRMAGKVLIEESVGQKRKGDDRRVRGTVSFTVDCCLLAAR